MNYIIGFVEFAEYFNGQEGRFTMSAKKDLDIQKAMNIS